MANVNNGIVVSNPAIELGKPSVRFKELINPGIIVIGKRIFVAANIIPSVK
ncbi:hypothetical protein LPL03_17710 [Lactiplantibacillus argentoratensis]|nr:hypothetical protein LPL03_17710 [Lactiplantibacillus argentoratensis]